jgi:two-component system sensor histidine kinase YesM
MRGNDELGMLGKAFSGMSLRIKELIDKTYKEEIALRDSQIQALQSRINPHFINNALEDINWQARMDGSEQASRMVSALSVLLNATMANREKRVLKLREELEVADAYIFFAQERFGDRLTIRKEIEEATLEDELPLLTLQPVLENAMEHGIAPAGGGEILLKCAREGESLAITVVNGGKELDEEDRARIDIALESGSTGNHVGLGNIAGRLKLIYHGQAGITVEKDEMKRTVARITIPQNRPKERRA